MSKENTIFLNVEVIAVPEVDDATGNSIINVTLEPPVVTVTGADTVISYQLVDPTPAELRFTGVNVAPPNDGAGAPEISTDGRSLTFNDITTRGDFAVTFEFASEPEPQAALRGATDRENRPH